jgi:hypothetical protein
MDKEFERPDWTPLERLIGDGCCQFMWMWGEGGIEFYKHIATALLAAGLRGPLL